MKILLYDNTQMTIKSSRYFCASGTGEFAKELVDLGHTVTMFGQQVFDPSSTSSFDIIEGGISVAGLKRFKSKFLSYVLLYSLSIRYILKSDFVYFFYPTSYRYLPLVCRLFGKKYGLYVRGELQINNQLSHILYRNAYVVFTVAQYFTDLINTISHKEVAHTIRPMISYSSKDVVTNREYKEKERFEILFLSRIQKEKGVKELLFAIRDLSLKNSNSPSFHLTMAGGGDYLDTASNLIDELDIKDLVTVTGPINDELRKKALFMESDIYVLSTYNEGFPRTIYEAMIFGTPIITTFVGGIPSLMKDGVNCKMIEARSSKSIEEALSYAMNHYNEMIGYAHQATKTVLKVIAPSRLSHAQDVDRVIRSI